MAGDAVGRARDAAPAPPRHPMLEFADWFADAARDAPFDPTAVALATADASGRPSARTVLLKGHDRLGFRFFTNYDSRKGRELAANPRAALCFYWPWRDRQVRAEGAVERLAPAESDAYFASRPRGHQLGAWASDQSRPIASEDELVRREREAAARFADGEVSRPPYWGGYLLRPERIEFWSARANRLHERRLARWTDGDWHWERLAP